MILFKSAVTISTYLENARLNGKSVGFVPTMGALHQGHISLIDNSVNENDLTVCSIFINPTQFNNREDFKKYPVTIESDIELLEGSGCDVLFLPDIKEMYPEDSTKRIYHLGYLETILEGSYRPGHFQGVCQVVDRLLNIIGCDKIYLGQKDFQQCMVIEELVYQTDHPVKIIISPTLREEDGLAMSSRNSRLNDQQRKIASNIYQALLIIKQEIKPGELYNLKTKASAFLESFNFKIDYIEIADSKTLIIKNEWDGKEELVVLAAASIDDIRLIDNIVLS